MEIVEIEVENIRPYEKNPRKNDQSVKYVMNSIEQFGFKVPVVIDANNVIVCGHTRFKAAKQLGMKTIPCIRADDLNEKQVRAFRLADNKVAEMSEWNMDLMNAEIDELFDFDFSNYGD